ncbi:unnamed protein product [Rhizophagus irregularis]|uniref:Uncharacterized protein n=1 Tax=Rhizophagus irregularis TaxID=588596 RepID=A0A2N1NWQ4_9GLOM|nr:hypothetical protein RhiirC2_550710 [Rhizophagus irregularis]CAB4381866.1 unnamed protein product [Rhizophagus irregularis]CAB5355675.1 unnamed protein product [Rhizophagus irregularis]
MNDHSPYQFSNIQPIQQPNHSPNQVIQYRQGYSEPNNFPHNHDQDFTWRIFQLIRHLYKWEEFVCLYIMTLDCDSEPNLIEVKHEIGSIKNFIKKFSTCLDTEITDTLYWINIIDRYWNSRTQPDEIERVTVREIINGRLNQHYFREYNNELIIYLKKMTKFQIETLRNFFLTRLSGYSHFASYLSKFRQQNDTTKSDDKMEDIEEIVYEGTMAKQEAETKLENHNYLNDLNERINNLQKDKDELTSKLKVAQIQLEDSENKIGILKTEINLLKKQTNFNGDVTDDEWRDDDENNSTQLVKDIEKLNRALNKITEVKRNVSEIKEEAVTELFSSLGCNTTVKDKQMKLVLVAALQQKLIKFILDYAKYYFEHANISQVQSMSVDNLEAAILFKTEDLIQLTTCFENTHSVTGENSRTLPTTLRKQCYAALGNRGFPANHPFIDQLAKDLISEMNKYRILDSDEKNKKFEKEIVKIIIQVLRIFRFRFKTQEPIPVKQFYKGGEDIDPFFMEGMWEGHHEDYEVEICSFPAIFVNSDSRVYTRAQVIARPKNGM